MTLILRPAESHDHDAINQLNQTAVPYVDLIDEEQFRYLIDEGLCILAQTPLGDIEGYIVLVNHDDEECKADDFRWFKETSDEPFVYIDQVVVTPRHQGRGIASELYRCAEKYAARSGARSLTCEIHLDPENKESHHFHLQHDFTEIGRRQSEGHQVMLMKKTVKEEPALTA